MNDAKITKKTAADRQDAAEKKPPAKKITPKFANDEIRVYLCLAFFTGIRGVAQSG